MNAVQTELAGPPLSTQRVIGLPCEDIRKIKWDFQMWLVKEAESEAVPFLLCWNLGGV